MKRKQSMNYERTAGCTKTQFMKNELALTCDMVNRVSVDTAKRYLRNAGLFWRMASRKPLLSSQHIKKPKSVVCGIFEDESRRMEIFYFFGQMQISNLCPYY